MKIAIYDLIHLEQILPLSRISIYLNIPAVFFTSLRFRDDLENEFRENSIVDFIYKADADKEASFMKQAVDIAGTRGCTVLILNSIHGKYYLWYLLLRRAKFKTVLTIHEVNGMFYSRPSVNIRKQVRHWGKKRLLSIVSGYIVNTEPMLTYMEQRGLTDKSTNWIPSVVYEDGTNLQPTTDTFTITVPGTIDHRRRNYQFVLDVYENCFRGHLLFRLVLAGMPYGEYGKEIQLRCMQLNMQGGAILFFEDEVPAADFDQLMRGSSLLWSPLVTQTSIFDDIPEIYGETKNSGSTHDAVLYARPMLIPASLKTAKELETSILRYNDLHSCVKHIRDVINDPDILKDLQTNAIANSRKFSIESVAEKYQRMIQSIS